MIIYCIFHFGVTRNWKSDPECRSRQFIKTMSPISADWACIRSVFDRDSHSRRRFNFLDKRTTPPIQTDISFHMSGGRRFSPLISLSNIFHVTCSAIQLRIVCSIALQNVSTYRPDCDAVNLTVAVRKIDPVRNPIIVNNPKSDQSSFRDAGDQVQRGDALFRIFRIYFLAGCARNSGNTFFTR